MNKQEAALTHDWIWRAIDALARRKGLSASALAKLAGLDPTAFNRSKRITPEGRARWPNTESIAKILEATNTTLDEFASLELGPPEEHVKDIAAIERVPLVGEVRDAAADRVVGELLQFRQRDQITSASRFALTVADSSLEPVYSQGNTLILSIEEARKGHRVVVKTHSDQAGAGLLVRSTRSLVAIRTFRSNEELIEVPRVDVEWIGRIIWARQ
jgi:phage repressor protein C with HTH and peptisase S24 domain